MAAVTKSRSSHTIGVECPPPGSFSFQRTLLFSLHAVGGLAFGATPVCSGPRHVGQKSRDGAAPLSRASAASITIKTAKILRIVSHPILARNRRSVHVANRNQLKRPWFAIIFPGMDIEAALTALLLGFASLPVAVHVHHSRGARGSLIVGVIWLSTTIAFTWASRTNRPDPRYLPPETSMPTEVPTAGYATSDTCRSCHPDEYHSWHSSYHRSMTQLPSKTSVLGDFADRTVEEMGHRFDLSTKGENFFVKTDFLANWVPAGFPTPRSRKQIKLLTGSHFMQVYWTSTGDTRKLEMLPIVHLVEQDRWVPRDSVFLMPTRHMGTEAGRWNSTCIKCHTTQGEPRMDDAFKMDTQVAEFGIACEECHGPGEEHIAANQNPQRRFALHQSGEPDPTIVNPARLSAKRQSEVCGQCHGTFFDRQHGAQNAYRPGDDLFATHDLLETDDTETIERIRADRGDIYLRGKFWPDGVLRVAGRELNGLVRSPCYTHGDEKAGIMSCLDCHSSHTPDGDTRPLKEWANDQLQPQGLDNTACLKCHEEFHDTPALTRHTHHSATSTGSLCYNCHMPHTTYGLMKGVRNHNIGSPDISVTRNTGRPNACNQCHLNKTIEWTGRHLHEWFDQPLPDDLTEEEKNVASSIIRIVKGDGSQRALAAWTMGWDSAKEVSGTDWLAPYLIQLLDDPYHAVRFIAQRSLRKLPDYRDLQYDFIADENSVTAAKDKGRKRFESSDVDSNDPILLMDSAAKPDPTRFNELLKNRDNRPISIAE